MENKSKQFINDNKGFVVFYLIWFLLHFFFISAGVYGGGQCGLWPFANGGTWCDDSYNFKDLLFYLIVPIVIWGIWKLIGKDVKKKNDENY